MRKIKKGDEVVVISGKDKGKRGRVLQILSKDLVVIENINMVKKHQKGNLQKKIFGKIVDKEMPLHISNVSFYSLEKNIHGRVGFKILNNKEKVRELKGLK